MIICILKKRNLFRVVEKMYTEKMEVMVSDESHLKGYWHFGILKWSLISILEVAFWHITAMKFCWVSSVIDSFGFTNLYSQRFVARNYFQMILTLTPHLLVFLHCNNSLIILYNGKNSVFCFICRFRNNFVSSLL